MAISADSYPTLDVELLNRAKAHIERIADRKIKGFLGTIDADGEYYDPVHKQNQSLSQHIIADYHGRFLIELVQNAHDAHSRERADGKIAVLLASDEGQSGTLYIANTGQPFLSKNVDALCEMGLSSKPPGEAVGNKGLGFRSVRHVTDVPQIFSRLVEGEGGAEFDGYCFTFARGTELDPLLPDARTRELARSDLPAFYIPRWLKDAPENVLAFASRGFSTVVRLPLRNEAALDVVRNEMIGLSKADAPLLLFLRRIKSLEAIVEGARLAKDAFSVTFTRDEKPVLDDANLAEVDLGENGTFWVVRSAIPEEEMQAAVAEGLDSGALPQSWKGWTGPGEVALAVPVGDDSDGFGSRLYTFLPMGRGATSPFRGHLHGSFFPSSNRMSLDPTIGVNSLVLDHAVRLAAATAQRLVQMTSEESVGSPVELARRSAIDILLWKTPPSLFSTEAGEGIQQAESLDLGTVMALEIARRWQVPKLDDATIVPVFTSSQIDGGGDPIVGWFAPIAARRVSVTPGAFSIEVIARHGASTGVAPIWAGLGVRRIDALVEFLSLHLGSTFKERLSTQESASIAEALAREISLSRTADFSGWTAFYRDLSDFVGGDGSALAGKRILICQDGSLRETRPAGQPEPHTSQTAKRQRRRAARDAVVFVPPRRGETEQSIGEEFYPPAPLREFFAFLHDRLPWYGELAAARQFLERDLAQPFESEALLTRISQIVERDATKRVRTAGLRWAFAIWRRSVAIKRPIALNATYRLYVPTTGGEFVRAVDAVFSSAWPDRTLGYLLQRFLEVAPENLSDIEDLRGRRIAPPAHSTFGKRLIDEWTDFLIGIGVQRGLHPRSVDLPHYVQASQMTAFAFMADIGLPESFSGLLKKDISSRPGNLLRLPSSTNYEIVQPLWWMPGQSDVDRFSDEAFEAYARLIVEWIPKVEHRQLWVEVRHEHSYRSDTRDWPTPLAAFLRSSAWVPCEEPSDEGLRRRRYAPAEVWLPSASDRYPPFLRRPSFRFARALDRAPEGATALLRKHAGFKTLNSPDTLQDQAAFLASQFADGCVRKFYERELINIYSRVWQRLSGEPNVPPQPGAVPSRLLVRRQGQLSLASVAGAATELVYVRDSGDAIAASLVDVIGDPLFEVRVADPAKVGLLMRRLYGNKVRLTSELKYEINVDGLALASLPLTSTLVQRCPWLRSMLAVALEALDSVDMNRLPADRSSIIQSIDRVELLLASSVTFSLEGRDVTPTELRPAYHFERTEGQSVIVVLGHGGLSWPKVEAALPAIGEAIRHPAVVPHMKLLVRQLASDGISIDDRPVGQTDLLKLCRALELSEQATEAARDSLGERIDRLFPWLRAVVFDLGGENALEIWVAGESDAAEDGSAVLDLLRKSLPEGARAPDDVLEAIKASFSVAELRERLDLDFAAFNASLVATGSSPDVDPEGQAAQLAYFVDENRIAICEALRELVAPSVLGFEPDARYREARDALSQISADEDWLPRYQRVPDDLLATRVDAWLVGKGAPVLGSAASGLADLNSVRAANTVVLRKTAAVAQPLVRAWAIQHGVVPHDVWREVSHAEAELRRKLDEAGAFDCRAWTDTELLRWFGRLAVWPQGMPLSTDRTELGVAQTEVEAQAQRAREDREQMDRQARSVQLNGEFRDPETVDWLKLSDEVSSGLSRAVLNRPIGTFADLIPTADLPKRGGGGGGGGGGAFVGVPQAKKDMIGLLGELTVYHWLKARQPGHDIDACWVSSNSEQFTGRKGCDGLGYDFRIAFNKQTWFIEVKASTEDPCRFELGETEVRRARDVARSRSAERYVVAYVANVGSTKATTIDILPNPLGPDADGVLNIAGDSIRFNFGRRR